ncbi:CatB-related O-acetyltransferase [Pontitalea aquivivens]|uniref:CatB-related O-acetyltransferase n=1 Tax=Pontitalea aquivivens TaxID=3388663 RepID=UPI003970AA4D
MSTALQFAASVHLAGDVFVEEPVRVFSGCSLSNVRIGAFSYVSPGASLHNASVGRYCSIGDGVKILSQHPHGSLTTSPFPYQRLFAAPFDADPLHDYARVLPTTIGNDVWIGSGAKIKSGITIGDGAIVGAGAVVTRDVVPFSIVGGVPAEIIRFRFSNKVILEITNLAWWNYNVVGQKFEWQDPFRALSELSELISSGGMQPFAPRCFKVWKGAEGISATQVDRLDA